MKFTLNRTNLNRMVIATINAIKVKACVVMSVNISLIAMVVWYYSSINFSIDAEHLVLTLGGGWFRIDAVASFIFCIPFLVMYFLIRQSIKGILLFFIRLNIVLFFIDVISIIVGPFLLFSPFHPESWQYVRGCAGTGFLVFWSSALWLITKQNFGRFLEVGIGIFSPPITLYTVAFGIKNFFISWMHFYD